MWPIVDAKNGTIEDLDYSEVYRNEEDCSDPNISIKEIVMVYAGEDQLEYDKANVPFVVEYDTDFGVHTILFSKVQNLEYVNTGTDWTATFTSVKTKSTHHDDGIIGVNEERLTDIFQSVLREVKKKQW